ncbi:MULTISPECIES: MCE family protein [Prauserella salsuginis group]|uniref:MCE family protein n=1 Tax=Prauserella salsuginis TaxID=387889 RepID=A0ABW6G3Z9_9PSEU|nr:MULTISPECIES: MCE family protein [Prauserella salsuginis group]MCR3718318.1 phospholipid/cholesterol/gamma-HCH transport system substrate-binding protein [Prauserella flava]MCR3732888.1 phospholipid/cholesterol/gamma-HCH transport system substrate-binding protein [Prauserella salsuginis]
MRLTPIVTKLTAFVAACALAAVLVVNTLTDPLPGDTRTYHAVFTDAHGLYAGSDVTIAGVRVGTVRDLRLDRGRAHVTFEVSTDQRVPAGVHAAIHYADLLGSRHLALAAGPIGDAAAREGADDDEQLQPGATIPVSRTRPPLDLTALFNGFKPLFEAVEPGEVNRLARTIVAVFQGEGPAVESLLSNVVSLTSTVNDKEQVLDRLLRNLTSVLDTMNGHTEQFTALVGGLKRLTSYAAQHRGDIATALDSGTKLAGSLNTLLAGITPNLSEDITALKTVSSSLVDNTGRFDTLMAEAPDLLDTVGRATDYGSWVNVYVCNLRVDVTGDAPVNLSPGPHSEVCR